MAQISLESIRKIEKQRNSIHEKVETTYTTFEDSGKKYVQIDTYGRIGRENPEKLSQSFQLDRETARFLVKCKQSSKVHTFSPANAHFFSASFLAGNGLVVS